MYVSGINCDDPQQFLYDERLSDRLFSAGMGSKRPASDGSDCPLDSCEEDERNTIFSHLENAEFADYSHCVSQNIETSPYAYIPTRNGTPRLVKKSAIAWFAESGVRRLSNDRVSRVMQTANISERQKSKVIEVGKQVVNLGDFCIFKNVEEDNYYLGNILSLASIEENSTRRKVVWDWDGLDNKTAALCNWWEFERFKDGKLTGKLRECRYFTHGFHSCKRYYICSCPPPETFQLSQNPSELLLRFPTSVVLLISSLFEHMPVPKNGV